MSLLIGFLTFILVVNCLFLMLLILVQLPKKEAGAGLAFGAGAVDTLIGAGSGNALTQMTKYAAGAFLLLAVLLAVMNTRTHQAPARSLQEQLAKKSSAAPMLPAQTPKAAPATGLLSNNVSPGTPANSAPVALSVSTNPLSLNPIALPANNGASNPAPQPAGSTK